MHRMEKISCHNYVAVSGYAYFSNWFYNGLFKVEILTGKTFFLGCFDGEKYNEINLHWEVFLRNERIYFCPRRSRHVHIYNLKEKSLHSVEVRSETQEFYKIQKVILDENDLFLIPDKKIDFISKLDLNSLEVEQIEGRPELTGVSLSEHKENFPAGELVKKSEIERADLFFWRQIFQGVWYGFLPFGRHLLKYTEGMEQIEVIPLIVMNEARLKEYLIHVEWQIWMERDVTDENRNMNISRFIDIFKIVKAQEHNTLELSLDNGEKIWEVLRERE